MNTAPLDHSATLSTKARMRPSRRKLVIPAAITLAVTVALSGCASAGGVDSDSVTGIPEQWIISTEEGWPSSEGYGGNLPVLSRDDCLLTDTVPRILQGEAELTNSGWGGYGNGQDGYRYICGLHLNDSYSGELQLMRGSEAGDAERTFEEFRDQASTAQQENSVSSVTSGKLELLVLTRWYPTNPQGRYQALYFDEDANALVSLGINSLDEVDFEALTPQDVADVLVETMATSS